MIARIAIILSAFAAPALANPAGPAPLTDDTSPALHSTVGWGNTVKPRLLSLSTEGGYDGAAQRTRATAVVEATLVEQWAASAFAGVSYGDEKSGASRPSIGLAVQLLDPRRSIVGVRVTGAYKPEGFSEPEGELETTVVVSHLVDRDVVRGFAAYGSDPEGAESDLEVGAGYLHHVSDRVIVGATARYRHAIAAKTDMVPRWDLIGGGIGGYTLGRWRLELLLGGGTQKLASSTSRGLLGLASVGVDL